MKPLVVLDFKLREEIHSPDYPRKLGESLTGETSLDKIINSLTKLEVQCRVRNLSAKARVIRNLIKSLGR